MWLDEAEINIGDSLTDKIGTAIDNTDFFAVVLSHHSVDSPWVQTELRVGIAKELAQRRVAVLPLLLERIEMPPFLRDKQYADFSTPEAVERNFPALLRSLGIDPAQATAPHPEPPLPSPSAQTPAAVRLQQFDDILILELDDRRSYKPDPAKTLYNLFLRLSALPSEEWRRIFEAERSFPRHSMWRKAWIDGQYIVVHCPLNELERFHARDLHDDLRSTNSKFRRYLQEQAQEELRDSHEARLEREQFAEIKKRLNLEGG